MTFFPLVLVAADDHRLIVSPKKQRGVLQQGFFVNILLSGQIEMDVVEVGSDDPDFLVIFEEVLGYLMHSEGLKFIVKFYL